MIKWNKQCYTQWWKLISLIKSTISWLFALSNRSFIDVAVKYFIRMSDNSAHSARKCLTVRGQRQAVHSGRSSPVRRYECVSLVWPIRSRLITTESLRFSPGHTVSPTTGFMEFNLFLVQLFQLCCHLFKQSLEICGNMSCAFHQSFL